MTGTKISALTSAAALTGGESVPAVQTGQADTVKTTTGAIANLANAVFNVKAYGAKGDGTTDDTTAIQAAITAAGTGGTVYLPPAVYVTQTLNISSQYFTIRGERGSTLKLKASTNAAMFLTANDSTQRNGFRLYGFAIDGNAQNQSGSAPLIDVYGYDDFIADSLYILNPRGSAIRMGASGSKTCLNPYLTDLLIRGDATYSQANGIELDSQSSDGHISNCDIGQFYNGVAILLSGHFGGFIADTDTWQAQNGVKLFQAHRTRLDNVLADGATFQGFFVQQTTDVQLTNCQARESSQAAANTYAGIHFEGTSGTHTTDVTVTGCRSMGSQAKYGIELLQYVTNCSIVGGSYDGNQTAASLIGTGVSSVRVAGAQGIQDSSWPSINVKDYGAVGDGSTDDSTAIQNAINAAVDARFNGIATSVFFPTGKYYIATGLTCTLAGITLVGEAQTGTSDDLSIGCTNIIVGNGIWGLTLGSAGASDYRGPRVENLHFYEKNAGQATGGLRLLRINNGTFRNVACGSFTAGTGILVDGTGDESQYNTFENCRVGNCLVGYDQKVANGTRWIGGYADGSHNVAYGNVANGQIGFKLESGDTFCSLGTNIQGYDTLIQIAGNFAPQFYGVRLENFKTAAISITSTATDAQFYGSSDNSINSSAGTGISIASGATGTVVGIDFRNCATPISDSGSGTRQPFTASTSVTGYVTGSDVTISSTNSYFDGPSVSLTPGTWLLTGQVALLAAGTGARLWTARLWDGTTDLTTGTFEVTGSAAAGQASIPLSGVVTIAANKTYKISATSDTGTTDKIVRTAGPTANKASVLNAVKL